MLELETSAELGGCLSRLAQVEVAASALAHNYAAFSRYTEASLRSSLAPLVRYLSTAPTPVGLDVGAGTGIPAQVLKALLPSTRLLAVDQSAEMLQRCVLADVHEECYCADAASLPLPDSAVDFAFSVHAFHLMKNKALALCDLARTVKPGGMVALITNTPGDLRRQLFHQMLPRFSSLDVPRHFDRHDIVLWSHTAKLELVNVQRAEYYVEFPTQVDFLSFLSCRPFFGLQQMPDDDFAADLSDCRLLAQQQLPHGPVRSYSALTSFILRKPPY